MAWLRLSRKADGTRLIAAAMVTLVTLLACNLPVVPLYTKDTSVPFPCQNRPCGCRDAESCWRECCCFSDSEKLAWAERNGVTPPDYFLKKLAGSSGGGGATCSKCCCQKEQPDQGRRPDPRRSVSVRLLTAVRKCQGAGPVVYGLPETIPSSNLLLAMFDGPLVECLTDSPLIADSPFFQPPTPPPRSW